MTDNRNNRKKTLVLLSEIRDDLIVYDDVYPIERKLEIDRVSNLSVKREKAYAWKLLSMGLERFLQKPITELNISKKPNGKWVCDECYFSISHSSGVVMIAVSEYSVGVDIEKISRHRIGLEEKILSPREIAEYRNIDDMHRSEYVIKKWTQKESIFKSMDKDCFHPTAIEGNLFPVKTNTMRFWDNDFAFSVCVSDVDQVTFEII